MGGPNASTSADGPAVFDDAGCDERPREANGTGKLAHLQADATQNNFRYSLRDEDDDPGPLDSQFGVASPLDVEKSGVEVRSERFPTVFSSTFSGVWLASFRRKFANKIGSS